MSIKISVKIETSGKLNFNLSDNNAVRTDNDYMLLFFLNGSRHFFYLLHEI